MNEDLLQKSIVFNIPGMNDVTVHHDLTYKQAGDIELMMDVYIPTALSVSDPVPIVMFVHGGPISPDLRLQPKDWGVFRSYGRLIAASGMACMTFNHRHWSRTDLDTPASDIATAISYIRENADSFHVDPDRLCIWGVSGAGPLLSFVFRERPAFVRCLVAYYAVMDLRHFGDQAEYETKIVETYSPAAHLGANLPTDLPIFVARAGLDRAILNESIDRFIHQALKANACLDVANHPHGRHAFDILDDDPRTHEIISRTIAFVSKHV